MIDQPMSRRRFLRIAGAACALLGGGGLAQVGAGCSRREESTNTTATIVRGETTTTERATTTTVTTSVERGRPLRIGVLSGKTGRLALFGKADEWWMDYAQRALPDGILCGDKRLRKISFLTEDHASSGEVSAKAATRLIKDARVDILLCSGGANVVNGAAAQAEALECPFICDFVPWKPFVFDRGGSLAKPFKWTYALAIGIEDVSAVFLKMWGQLTTNKKLGVLLPDDAQSEYWNDSRDGLPAAATRAGYEVTVPGLYPVGTRDFAPAIAEFQKNGCEICCGYLSATDLIAFWDQTQAFAYKPKIVSVAGGLLFPQTMEAMAPSAVNITAECLWHANWPFSDSITGKTALELADDYVQRTGEQWTAGIGQLAKFEWVVDVFSRMADILDKNDLLARVRTTRLQSCIGLIDFTAPVASGDPGKSKRPTENVYKAPVAGCQWVRSTVFKYEPRLVATVSNPEIPIAGTLQPMRYSNDA